MIRSYRCLPSLDESQGHFVLRWVQDTDIESIRKWRNAQMHVLRQTDVISREGQERYFARTIWPQMELRTPDTILVMIEQGGQAIGYGGLVHCQWDHKRAEISVLFAPEVAGNARKYREALVAFLTKVERYAFTALGLNRLTLETYDIRPFHISVLEEAGFVLEGRLREHVMVDGEPMDSLLHAKLARDQIVLPQPKGARINSVATRSILVPLRGGS